MVSACVLHNICIDVQNDFWDSEMNEKRDESDEEEDDPDGEEFH